MAPMPGPRPGVLPPPAGMLALPPSGPHVAHGGAEARTPGPPPKAPPVNTTAVLQLTNGSTGPAGGSVTTEANAADTPVFNKAGGPASPSPTAPMLGFPKSGPPPQTKKDSEPEP